LRDYNNPDQIGLEKTPEEYVERIVRVFKEVNRVLKPSGTLWLNLGDSYASGRIGRDDQQKFYDRTHGYKSKALESAPRRKIPGNLKPKDLVGIPWMVAFALRSAGWYLRQDIIWAKPNPMPESVKDRCTKSHEYIFMFSKNPTYYYNANAIKVAAKNPEDDIRRISKATLMGKSTPSDSKNGIRKKDKQRGHGRRHIGFNERWDNLTKEEQTSLGANKRSVWTVSTKPFPEAHFATYPEELITPCILAGCQKDGIILDPFMGAGTTALVALSHGRKFIGFDLNPDYIKIANKRLKQKFGMFYNP
jgi:DNA modification methylase